MKHHLLLYIKTRLVALALIRQALIIGLIAITSIAVPAWGWTVYPVKLELDMKSGTSKTVVVVLDNADSAELRRFELKPCDWHLTEPGEVAFPEPGKYKYSITQYMTFSPMQFTVGPGERKQIRVTLELPELAPGEYTGGLRATERTLRRTIVRREGVNVDMNIQCSYILQVVVTIPPAATQAPEIKDLSLIQPTDMAPANAVLTVANTGNVRVQPLISYSILGPDGVARFTSTPEKYLVMRESERKIKLPLSSDFSGKGKLVVKIDPGRSFSIKEAEKEIEVNAVPKKTPLLSIPAQIQKNISSLGNSTEQLNKQNVSLPDKSHPPGFKAPVVPKLPKPQKSSTDKQDAVLPDKTSSPPSKAPVVPGSLKTENNGIKEPDKRDVALPEKTQPPASKAPAAPASPKPHN